MKTAMLRDAQTERRGAADPQHAGRLAAEGSACRRDLSGCLSLPNLRLNRHSQLQSKFLSKLVFLQIGDLVAGSGPARLAKNQSRAAAPVSVSASLSSSTVVSFKKNGPFSRSTVPGRR